MIAKNNPQTDLKIVENQGLFGYDDAMKKIILVALIAPALAGGGSASGAGVAIALSGAGSVNDIQNTIESVIITSTVTNTTSGGVQLTATDPGGLVLSYSVIGLPPGLIAVNGGFLYGIPTTAGVFNVTVTVTNTSTGLSRQATTDEAGYYSIPNLLEGAYDLSVSASSFKPSSASPWNSYGLVRGL